MDVVVIYSHIYMSSVEVANAWKINPATADRQPSIPMTSRDRIFLLYLSTDTANTEWTTCRQGNNK